jgi:uncharacterized protein (TIGR03435 family)
VTSSNIRRLLATVGIVAFSYEAHAQSPVAFEAASIKRNLSTNTNTGINISGGRFTATNASMKTLIRNAYEILAFQLTGGPAWLDTDMYDIVATTGKPEKITPEQFKLLLKDLLADRFHLKVHWETRETSIYALVLAKDGPKFQENTGTQEPGINTQKGPGRGQMRGTREPISILASNLGNQLRRFVVDKTGLQGNYDWLLEWDPDPTEESTRPSLFTAVQQQLGLRLESQKGPVEILVIDSAEKPSDN